MRHLVLTSIFIIVVVTAYGFSHGRDKRRQEFAQSACSAPDYSESWPILCVVGYVDSELKKITIKEWSNDSYNKVVLDSFTVTPRLYSDAPLPMLDTFIVDSVLGIDTFFECNIQPRFWLGWSSQKVIAVHHCYEIIISNESHWLAGVHTSFKTKYSSKYGKYHCKLNVGIVDGQANKSLNPQLCHPQRCSKVSCLEAIKNYLEHIKSQRR